MSGVADFLNLPWDDALLRPTRVGDSWRGNSMFADRYQEVSTAPVGRWKEYNNTFDLAMIQAISDKTMDEMEYPLAELEIEKLTLLQRIAIYKEHATAVIRDSLPS